MPRRTAASIIAFLAVVVVDSVLVVTVPLLIKSLVDDGVIPKDSSVVVRLSLVVAVIAIADAVLTVISRWYSSRIGEGLINDLRTQVFAHVLRQPIAFFTRAQTGSLVSRLNNDVVGAQQAFTSVLSNVVSNIVSVVLVIAAMLALSWQLTLGLAAARAALPHPGQAHGPAAREPRAPPDDAQRRHGHADDRALQRRRRPARQALRQARA